MIAPPADMPGGVRSPAPGRACPIRYGYRPSDLARQPDFEAETLYVVGGLYGNTHALSALAALTESEPAAVLVFNGDFNWFNVDARSFEAVNREVLRHKAIRGNVETELASPDATAGCGCGYPEWVSDAEVERSNRIMEQLQAVASQFHDLRTALAALPMHLVANVGGSNVGIVHGDTRSLAGWSFSQERLRDAAHRQALASEFAEAGLRIIASTHTCLPVIAELDTAIGRTLIVNNGAAGMPNFKGRRHGVITRISTRPANDQNALYGTSIEGLHVDALVLDYDHEAWLADFLGNWPEDSPAHASYWRRITSGPDYALAQAVRLLRGGNDHRNERTTT